MASLLRGISKTVGLRSSSKLLHHKFFTSRELPAQVVARRSYGGSTYRVGRSRNRASPDYVVGGTIAACVGVWVYTESTQRDFNNPKEPLQGRRDRKSQEVLEQNFVASRRNVDQGRWWTLLTSTFTHFTVPHLALNMMTLWNVGRIIVMLYGPSTYCLLWLGAGVGGSALQIYWSDIMKQAVKRKILNKPFWIQRDAGGVGASGSISGLIGVVACASPQNSLWAVGVVAGSVLCLENNWLPGIGHKCHLGGMAVGATWWLLFLRRRRGW